MNFKKSKDDVISDANIAAVDAVGKAFSSLKYNIGRTTPEQHIDLVQHAINMGIYEAIKSIVHNIYTDEEFEQDIMLRPKP